MTEIIFIKRKAREGEMGLFVSSPVFEEEWDSLKIGSEVKAECTVPANLRYLKFFWALVGKVAENSPDGFLDKEDCKERILLEARHFKAIHDPLRNKTEIKAKSVAGLSGDAWIRLLRRVTYVVVTKFIPGMDENALTAEIQAMIGPDTQPQADAPVRKRAPKVSKAAPEQIPSPAPPLAQETALDCQPGGEMAGEAAVLDTAGHLGGLEPTLDVPPTNELEYLAFARQWITEQTDHRTALEFYDSPEQIELRAACRLSIGTGKLIRRELAMKFEPVKEAK